MTTSLVDDDTSSILLPSTNHYFFDHWIKPKIVLHTDYGDRTKDYSAWRERIKTTIENTPPISHIKISFRMKSSFGPLQIIYNLIENLCRRINWVWHTRWIHVHEIIPGVYLGDLYAFEQINTDGWLKFSQIPIAKIDSVVSCRKNRRIDNPNVKQIIIPVSDRKDQFKALVAHASQTENPHTFWEQEDGNHEKWFSHTFSFIQTALDAKENVLIHCHGGVSRSSTVLIAYLMKEFDVTYEQALNYVQSRRSGVDPNEGFRAGLNEYDRIKSSNGETVRKPS